MAKMHYFNNHKEAPRGFLPVAKPHGLQLTILQHGARGLLGG